MGNGSDNNVSSKASASNGNGASLSAGAATGFAPA
jgi:hypothetical protein